MSVEELESPISHDSDSISIASRPSRYSRSSKEHPANTLTRHISHTSSVGGVVPTTIDRTWTRGTAGTADTHDPAFEIDFGGEDDKSNPQNWSLWYKGIIILIFSYATTSTVLYSTSYTSAIPGMQKTFGIDETEGILGVTTYLLGMASGSVVLAPLSEMYGRRPIYLIVMLLFVVFVIPTAVAQNMATILIVRFFGAFCAAAMISNAPGTVNDSKFYNSFAERTSS